MHAVHPTPDLPIAMQHMNDSAIATLFLSERRIAYVVTDQQLMVLHLYDPHQLLGNGQPDQRIALYEVLPELIGSEAALEAILQGDMPRFELGRVQRVDERTTTPIVRLVCMPTRDTNGTISGVVQMIEDVTEIGETERDIAQQRNELRLLQEQLSIRNARLSEVNLQLERAVKIREEFLAAMSHELRTPLTAVLGMTELMQRGICGPTNDDQNDALRVIAENGRHLLDLINDILDYAKVEANRLELNLMPIPIEDMCRSVIRMIMPMARKKLINVRLDIDPQAIILEADQRRLKQILINLLGNAVKFTPEQGQIGLDVRANIAQQQLHFIVWDTGIGIPAHEITNLFQPFMQLESGNTRKYIGTGLGLALVRQLAELHQGSVSVTSTPGQGSRFIVTLPWLDMPLHETEVVLNPETALLVEPEERNVPVTPGASQLGEPPQLLIATEDSATYQTLASILSKEEYRLSLAIDHETTLEQALVLTPDLILLDTRRGSLDGIHLCEILRSDPRTTEIPIILISDTTDETMRQDAFQAGADDLLLRPFNPLELQARIHTITKLNRYRRLLIERTTAARQLEQSNQALIDAYDATLQSWTTALELRDHETEGHCRRVRDLTIALARTMGVSEEQLVHIRRGAMLHDIGKIGIPDEILFKRGPLSGEERSILERHPLYAYQILKPIEYLQQALDIPYAHHERWDGTGYPRGLKGSSIPLAARIFAVVEVYDALRNDRPYRAGWPEEHVLAYIQEHAGSQFDPDVVVAFMRLREHG